MTPAAADKSGKELTDLASCTGVDRVRRWWSRPYSPRNERWIISTLASTSARNSAARSMR